MEWELTSSQAHSFVPIYRPQKSCAPHSYVNFETLISKTRFSIYTEGLCGTVVGTTIRI